MLLLTDAENLCCEFLFQQFNSVHNPSITTVYAEALMLLK